MSGLAGSSAASAAWLTSFDLEVAKARGEHASGLMLDIFKAFDQLDRRKVTILALRAGAPFSLVRAWRSYLESLWVVNALATSVGQ
eukprot:6378076-Alexandrium_andersonii.AAC.1